MQVEQGQDQRCIVYDRDFEYDYFGFKTLERSYLMRCDGEIAERPQHMIMRVAIGIHGQDVDAGHRDLRAHVPEVLHARDADACSTPGRRDRSYPPASCSAMKEDSIEGIYDTLKRLDARPCAIFMNRISKYVHNIGGVRALQRCACISQHPTSGHGLVHSRFERYQQRHRADVTCIQRHRDATSTREAASARVAFAIYLEPWHADIETFLDLKKNHGNEL